MITVLVAHSPDYGNEIQVWDGDTNITADRKRIHIVEIDAGRGYEYEDWVGNATGELDTIKHVVPRAVIAAIYADPPGKQYIDGWPEDDD